MSDDVVMRFHIEAYTPDTIPMARLAEYIGELAKLLGDPTAVHFVCLEPGSTNIVHRIEREAAPKAMVRAASVRLGNGPVDALRAYQKLNRLLGEDNGSGALLDERGAEIIVFPGVKRPAGDFNTVMERGSIDGKLVRVGGKRDPVPLLLERGDIDYSGVVASRDIAESLGKVLFRQLRLFGNGSWFRTADGEWLLDRFRVESFEVLDPAPLAVAVQELRAAAAGEWVHGVLRDIHLLRQGDPG